uniref:Uncharacterized protein n=1 Tax=Myoviridae sp. ctNQV2 TaxID=2827683 RepID=A0A8S5S0B4_9CAUD|nr:MAG TPA: hypothetical protein [Myoviridae sp. ctNQV2]
MRKKLYHWETLYQIKLTIVLFTLQIYNLFFNKPKIYY